MMMHKTYINSNNNNAKQIIPNSKSKNFFQNGGGIST